MYKIISILCFNKIDEKEIVKVNLFIIIKNDNIWDQISKGSKRYL